ncbi:MAG: Ig-like domain-containing protein, partial [Burkholderiales bacterium]
KGGSVRIDIAKLVSDVDSNVLTLSLAKPGHGTLTRNADGTYTYTPKRGYTGVDGFGYSVSDGSLSATGWIGINVVREEDERDHHHGDDSGHHNGDDDGEHKAYAGSAGNNGNNGDGDGEDRGASIVVRSSDPNAAPITIDWNGSASSNFTNLRVTQPDWLAQSLGIPQPDKRSLAEITGLVVRLKG